MAQPFPVVQVVIPTYRRLQALQSTYNQLKDNKRVEMIFVAHESDEESQYILKKLSVKFVIDTQPPSGVNATNRGYWAVTSDWFVIGQDDFKWHKGWLDKVWKYTEEAKVIGFNDGSNSGRIEHSVGWLIKRGYVQQNSLTPSFRNVIFFPHYIKNFSDDELNNVAKYRNVWKYAEDCVVEHLHPGFGKGQNDETYSVPDQKFQQDADLYNSRKHLWGM